MVDIIFGKLSITILHILYILTGQYFFVRGGFKKKVWNFPHFKSNLFFSYGGGRTLLNISEFQILGCTQPKTVP